MDEKISIIGTKVDNVTRDEALQRIQSFFGDRGHHHIVTVNPEFVMAARRDPEFQMILNQADLSVADGKGIAFAARRVGHRLRARITGVDLIWDIVQYAAANGHSLYLLGAKQGVAQQAAYKIRERYPDITIVAAESGYRRWHRHIKDTKLVEMINRKQPAVLLVAFGHGKQEKWIYHNLPSLPSVQVAMGVGGSFDYISGRVSRAPQLMQKLGLEWLYRLVRQPWRLPRIMTAVIKFSYTVLRNKS